MSNDKPVCPICGEPCLVDDFTGEVVCTENGGYHSVWAASAKYLHGKGGAMKNDSKELYKALILTAGTLQSAATNPAYRYAGQNVVMLSPKSIYDIAKLLERAADALDGSNESE